MTSLALTSIMDSYFSLVTLLVEEAERRGLVVVLGLLFLPSRVTRGHEPPLNRLLGLRAVQGSASTLSFLRVLSPPGSLL